MGTTRLRCTYNPVVSIILWNSQQNNVNLLEYKIEIFKEKIARNLSSSELFKIEDRLKLDKDILVIEKDKTTIQNGVYTTLVQALGGLALIINAYLGFCNFKIGEKNLKVAEDKQVTERFSKSIEHLGSDKIDVRLGGIYALEQIAIDSPGKYHWTIVEILSAFVREKCQIKELPTASIDSELDSQESESDATSHKPEKVRIDIQTALTVLGRRNEKQDPTGKHIDLRKVNLAGVELPNATLFDIDLMGSNLSYACLNGVKFGNARLNFANLNHAILSPYNRNCTNLSAATFIGATLSNVNFDRADLSGTNFTGAKLDDVNNFSTAYLGKINYNNSPLPGANFTNARLSGDLRRTNFANVNLTNANLNIAILDSASFANADMTNTNLCQTLLDDADLSQCRNLTQEQLNTALTYRNAKLPDYLSNAPIS
jgi:uncharacterized protein YjbI with pentapeptide repeats